MPPSEQYFWKSITQLWQLPWIIVLLIIVTFPSLLHIPQIYYNLIYQWTLGAYARPLILWWWGIFVSYWVGTIIKYMYHKPRPVPRDTSTLWKKINAWSMPSIHASNALICGFVFINTWSMHPLMDNMMLQFFVVTIVWVFIVMSISLSRIVLDKHYPIDVLAGSLLGSVIIAVLSTNSYSIISLLDRVIILFI